jgi:hypothetical protein
MKIKVAGFPALVAALVLASLACNALGSGALLQDDFSGSDKPWGIGTDADSSVQYSNDALNFMVNKDLYFVWSTPNAEEYEKIHNQYIVLFCCYGRRRICDWSIYVDWRFNFDK